MDVVRRTTQTQLDDSSPSSSSNKDARVSRRETLPNFEITNFKVGPSSVKMKSTENSGMSTFKDVKWTLNELLRVHPEWRSKIHYLAGNPQIPYRRNEFSSCSSTHASWMRELMNLWRGQVRQILDGKIKLAPTNLPLIREERSNYSKPIRGVIEEGAKIFRVNFTPFPREGTFPGYDKPDIDDLGRSNTLILYLTLYDGVPVTPQPAANFDALDVETWCSKAYDFLFYVTFSRVNSQKLIIEFPPSMTVGDVTTAMYHIKSRYHPTFYSEMSYKVGSLIGSIGEKSSFIPEKIFGSLPATGNYEEYVEKCKVLRSRCTFAERELGHCVLLVDYAGPFLSVLVSRLEDPTPIEDSDPIHYFIPVKKLNAMEILKKLNYARALVGIGALVNTYNYPYATLADVTSKPMAKDASEHKLFSDQGFACRALGFGIDSLSYFEKVVEDHPNKWVFSVLLSMIQAWAGKFTTQSILLALGNIVLLIPSSVYKKVRGVFERARNQVSIAGTVIIEESPLKGKLVSAFGECFTEIFATVFAISPYGVVSEYLTALKNFSSKVVSSVNLTTAFIDLYNSLKEAYTSYVEGKPLRDIIFASKAVVWEDSARSLICAVGKYKANRDAKFDRESAQKKHHQLCVEGAELVLDGRNVGLISTLMNLRSCGQVLFPPKSAQRPEPFGLVIVGSPGIGKTFAIEAISRFVVNREKLPSSSNMTAYLSMEREFQDGVDTNALTVVLNDFLATKEEKLSNTVIDTMQRLVDTVPFVVNMASLTDKENSRLAHKMVIITTNTSNYQITSGSGADKLNRRYRVAKAELKVDEEWVQKLMKEHEVTADEFMKCPAISDEIKDKAIKVRYYRMSNGDRNISTEKAPDAKEEVFESWSEFIVYFSKVYHDTMTWREKVFYEREKIVYCEHGIQPKICPLCKKKCGNDPTDGYQFDLELTPSVPAPPGIKISHCQHGIVPRHCPTCTPGVVEEVGETKSSGLYWKFAEKWDAALEYCVSSYYTQCFPNFEKTVPLNFLFATISSFYLPFYAYFMVSYFTCACFRYSCGGSDFTTSTAGCSETTKFSYFAATCLTSGNPIVCLASWFGFYFWGMKNATTNIMSYSTKIAGNPDYSNYFFREEKRNLRLLTTFGMVVLTYYAYRIFTDKPVVVDNLLDRPEFYKGKKVMRYWPVYGKNGEITRYIPEVAKDESTVQGVPTNLTFEQTAPKPVLTAMRNANSWSTDPKPPLVSTFLSDKTARTQFGTDYGRGLIAINAHFFRALIKGANFQIDYLNRIANLVYEDATVLFVKETDIAWVYSPGHFSATMATIAPFPKLGDYASSESHLLTCGAEMDQKSVPYTPVVYTFGDCGRKIFCPEGLLGIHRGRLDDDSMGLFQYISSDNYKLALNHFDTKYNLVNKEIQECAYLKHLKLLPGVHERSDAAWMIKSGEELPFKVLGHVPSVSKATMSGKATVLHAFVEGPTMEQPNPGKAKLGPDGKYRSLYTQRVRGYSKFTSPRKEVLDLLLGLETMPPPPEKKLGFISLDQALTRVNECRYANAVVVEKSVGPTLQAMNIRQSQLFDMDLLSTPITYKVHPIFLKLRQELLNKISAGIVEQQIAVAVPKDTMIKEGGAVMGKGRYFMVGDKHVVVLSKEMCLNYQSYYLQNRRTFGCFADVNTHDYRDWEEAYYYMTFGGTKLFVFEGDYQKMDTGHGVLNEEYKKECVRLCEHTGYTVDEVAKVLTMLHTLETRIINMAGNVVEDNVSLCSGDFQTLFKNSVVNRKNLLYAACIHFRNKWGRFPSHGEILKHIRLITCGDDFLFNPSGPFESMTGSEIVNYVAELGFTITAAQKDVLELKRMHISEVSFLKRKFKEVDGRITSPLALDSILSALRYEVDVKPGDEFSRTQSTITSQSLELFQHGREVFNRIKGQVEEANKTLSQPFVFPSFEEAAATFMKNVRPARTKAEIAEFA